MNLEEAEVYYLAPDCMCKDEPDWDNNCGACGRGYVEEKL